MRIFACYFADVAHFPISAFALAGKGSASLDSLQFAGSPSVSLSARADHRFCVIGILNIHLLQRVNWLQQQAQAQTEPW
jgi:hypothetical protein